MPQRVGLLSETTTYDRAADALGQFGEALRPVLASPCWTWDGQKVGILGQFLQDRASSSPSRSLDATVACHGVRWRPRHGHVTGEHMADHLAWHLTSAVGKGEVSTLLDCGWA